MWAGDAPWRTDAPDRMQLDAGHDDYYGHGRTDCPDLANSPYLGPPEQHALAVKLAGRGSGQVAVQGAGDATRTTCPPVCASAHPADSDATLRAVPRPGSVFAGWAGGCSDPQPTCTVRLNTDTAVTARFDRTRHRLVVLVHGPGRVRFASTTCARRCATLVEHGTALTLRATPSRGANFAGWSGACHGTRTCTYTAAKPATITARFRPARAAARS
jgi:hypothetical protein